MGASSRPLGSHASPSAARGVLLTCLDPWRALDPARPRCHKHALAPRVKICARCAALKSALAAPRSSLRACASCDCSFALLGLSKLFNLAAPIYLGLATDAIIHGSLPVYYIIMFGSLRFLVSLMEEAQRLVYLRVKQVRARLVQRGVCTSGAYPRAGDARTGA